jgi:hypothetical protein
MGRRRGEPGAYPITRGISRAAEIGLHTSASVGLRQTRGRPPRGRDLRSCCDVTPPRLADRRGLRGKQEPECRVDFQHSRQGESARRSAHQPRRRAYAPCRPRDRVCRFGPMSEAIARDRRVSVSQGGIVGRPEGSCPEPGAGALTSPPVRAPGPTCPVSRWGLQPTGCYLSA